MLAKPLNFYEELGLKPNATAEMIMKAGNSTKGFECLKVADCRSEYTRFGSSLQLNDTADFKFDWRLTFTVLFYMLFAFVHGAVASVEQKPGLRVSMGLGIIFCITEVQILQDIKA